MSLHTGFIEALLENTLSMRESIFKFTLSLSAVSKYLYNIVNDGFCCTKSFIIFYHANDKPLHYNKFVNLDLIDNETFCCQRQHLFRYLKSPVSDSLILILFLYVPLESYTYCSSFWQQYDHFRLRFKICNTYKL